MIMRKPNLLKIIHLNLFLFMFFVAGCEEVTQAWTRVQVELGLHEESIEAPLSPDSVKRVVSLDQGLTDIIFTVGAENYLVGISDQEQNGMMANKLPQIKTAPLDLKKIQSLRPDLILAHQDRLPDSLRARLTRAGFRINLFQFKEWKDVASAMQELGRLFSTEYRSNRAVDTLWAEWKSIRNLTGAHKPTAFILDGQQELYTFGNRSHISALIDDGGGRSLSKTLEGYRVPAERSFILAQNPDFLLITPAVATSLHELIRKHPFITATPAYKRRKIYLIAPELLLYGSPRYVEGAKEVAQIMFTDMFQPLH